jgi:hypothetical protein
MKYLFFLFIFTSISAFSQPEFSFYLYFEDALGNRDTITIGYDPLATDGIDELFGEENIISQAWDSVFEVRISDYYDRNAVGEQVSFNTEKCIQYKFSQPYFKTNRIEIDIHAKHFPIKISCDSTLLQTAERRGTFITSMLPGGWFDTGGFVTNLFYNPQTLINFAGFESWSLYPFNYYYLEASDSVFVCWAAIADSNVNTSNVLENKLENKIEVFPNPVFNNSNLHISSGDYYNLCNIQGHLIKSGGIENKSINLENIPPGVYYIKVEKDRKFTTSKLIIL